MSANALRLRLSSSTVYAKQIVLVAQPCLARTLRVYLFAMSAALDVRKCFALASLFACGQLHKCRLQTKFADNAVRLVASLLSKQKKRKTNPKRFVFLGDGADNRT